MARSLISDHEWALFQGFIHASRYPNGRKNADNRLVVDGSFWIARTGSPQRDLPEEFGKWSSVCRLFRRWTLAGLWEDILNPLNHAGIAPDKLQMVDRTVIRADQHAAGAKGGLLTTSSWLFERWVLDQDPSSFVNGAGLPMRTEITLGQDSY